MFKAEGEEVLDGTAAGVLCNVRLNEVTAELHCANHTPLKVRL